MCLEHSTLESSCKARSFACCEHKPVLVIPRSCLPQTGVAVRNLSSAPIYIPEIFLAGFGTTTGFILDGEYDCHCSGA